MPDQAGGGGGRPEDPGGSRGADAIVLEKNLAGNRHGALRRRLPLELQP